MYSVFAEFRQVLHMKRKQALKADPKRTIFSFVGEQGYIAYVTVPGHPRVEPGMRVQAVLRKEGDWQTLVGWRDLATHELAGPDPKWHFGRFAASLGGLLAGALLWGYGWYLDSTQAQHFGVILLMVFGIACVFGYRALKRARQDLKELLAALGG